MPLRPTPVFGSASSFLFGSARKLWVDLALLAALGGAIFGLTRLAAEWTGALRPVFEIDLSPWALLATPSFPCRAAWLRTGSR